MDNKSIKDYDIVVSRSVDTNKNIPLLEINENDEYIAVPVSEPCNYVAVPTREPCNYVAVPTREPCNYVFINNMINNLVNLICCDNKRK